MCVLFSKVRRETKCTRGSTIRRNATSEERTDPDARNTSAKKQCHSCTRSQYMYTLKHYMFIVKHNERDPLAHTHLWHLLLLESKLQKQQKNEALTSRATSPRRTSPRRRTLSPPHHPPQAPVLFFLPPHDLLRLSQLLRLP